MSVRQRAIDRGRVRGTKLRQVIGGEVRLARRGLALSLGAVAKEVGISTSELSRIERGLAPWVPLSVLAETSAVVGLDLWARTYPGGSPLRDARHARLLDGFRIRLHRTLLWQTEVLLPGPGEQRAWDGMVTGPGWRHGTEAELNPIDGQALVRRIKRKARDGGVDGVILLLPDTRQARLFRREFAGLLTADFPVSGRRALELLAAGADPGGSAVVVL
jgi:transcriptional regulator with XRE-family HTH domain